MTSRQESMAALYCLTKQKSNENAQYCYLSFTERRDDYLLITNHVFLCIFGLKQELSLTQGMAFPLIYGFSL